MRISRPGVVVPVRVDPTGATGPTPGEVRGRGWRRAGSAGFYVPAGTQSQALDQRIVEAFAGTPDDAAVTGWAALAWLGARWFNGLGIDGRDALPVPVALPGQRGMRPRAGVVWSEDWLLDGEVVIIDGLRVTIPERSVSYEVRRAPSLIRACQVIDMAAADDLVDRESMTAHAAQLVARPGVRRLRTAIGCSEENVWSPQEVPMRFHWKRAVPRVLLVNAPIFGRDGRHLLTPDLLDPVAGVAGEYDGAIHLEEGPRRRDLNRHDLYRELGIEEVTMMSGAHDDVASFQRRLLAAYRRAERRATSPRAWTLDQPDWWVDTSTVARRRALSGDERARWLRRLAR